MPHNRPFDQNDRNLIDMLNDMMVVGMPRAGDPPADVNANTQLTFDMHFGCTLDCVSAVTITAHADTLFDGFNCYINALSGTVTLNLPFIDNTNSKTITQGNSALISCNGVKYRIGRMAAT